MAEQTEHTGDTVTYRCTTGHDIPAAALEVDTVVVDMDGGALVRICGEHGSPIAQTCIPPDYPPGV